LPFIVAVIEFAVVVAVALLLVLSVLQAESVNEQIKTAANRKIDLIMGFFEQSE